MLFGGAAGYTRLSPEAGGDFFFLYCLSMNLKLMEGFFIH